jgi:aminoglycoside phosphotransferase (APT) family kinase protein
MVPGAPDAARWFRDTPRGTLGVPLVERIVHRALPCRRVVNIEPLSGGLRNCNLKLQLADPPEAIVLRVYEHDPSLCQKEVDLIRLVAPTVPVSGLIHAEPRGWEEVPPFVLMRYIEGASFQELKHSGDFEAIAQAACAVGETLAAIGRVRFTKSGWLAPGPAVTGPLLEGANALPRFVDLCLASPHLERRVPAALRDAIHGLIWRSAPEIALLGDEACLVHGDFGNRNVLVRGVGGQWTVAAVLDWEFAVSGSPLADIGHFLRYEKNSRPLVEPHFANGYLRAGGKLPPNWRQLARLVDLAALCESLTHDYLPDTVVAELLELIAATAEDRDPHVT